jgi:hypothetical protein
MMMEMLSNDYDYYDNDIYIQIYDDNDHDDNDDNDDNDYNYYDNDMYPNT